MSSFSPVPLSRWIAAAWCASAFFATPYSPASADCGGGHVTPMPCNIGPGKKEAKKTPAANKQGGQKPSGKKPGSRKKGKEKPQGGGQAGHVIRDDVRNWILANNPGLGANFLTAENPDRVIKIPGGKSIPLFKTSQFLDANFRLTFFARRPEGSKIVSQSEFRLRRLLATPEFRERVLTHRGSYKIHGKKVSAREAYDYIRDLKRHLGVTASPKVKAPVGGGSGINAPSWAVWKAMNLFWHEACHCIGINHDSGGLSGPIAGTLRDMDRKKRWNYDTVDLNALTVPK